MMEVLGGKDGEPFIRLRNMECLAQGHPARQRQSGMFGGQ